MGSGPSSQRFSEHPQRVVRKVGSFGMEASSYTDEVNTVDHCRFWCYLSMMVIAVAAHLLQLLISWEKFIWMPSHIQIYIGFVWNLKLFQRSLTAKRLQDMAVTARQLEVAARDQVPVPLRLLAACQGQAISGAGGCRKLGFKVRDLRVFLRIGLSRNDQDHSARVIVCQSLIPFFQYMQAIPAADNWEWIRTRPTMIQFSVDASEYKYCIHRVPMRNAEDKVVEHFSPEEQRNLHHNQHEDLGRVRGLTILILKDDLRGTVEQPLAIGCETDNRVVLQSWELQKTKSTLVAERLEDFRDFLDGRHIQLNMTFRSGEFMMNRRQTDAGSREVSKWFNWPLRKEWVRQVRARLACADMMMIDLFAEATSAQFPAFVSRHYHPQAKWMNALAQPWTRANPLLQGIQVLWIFPPPALIKKVVDKLAAEQGQRLPAILVVPKTPSAAWFLRVLQLWPTAVRMELPQWKVCCRPMELGKVKVGKMDTPPGWELIALRL